MPSTNQMARLTIRLWYYCDLLNNMSMRTDSDYADAASIIVETVLAMKQAIRLECVPRAEWVRRNELDRQCDRVTLLLLNTPIVTIDEIRAECLEMVEQFCYLLEFESIAWAGAVESLVFE